jgi:hypothetical protein
MTGIKSNTEKDYKFENLKLGLKIIKELRHKD